MPSRRSGRWSPVTFTIDRLETNPRFGAAISRPANAANPGAAAHRHGGSRRQYRVAAALRDHRTDPQRAVADVHGRENFGRDPIWEGHFATEVAQAQISVDAVLYEADIPLKQLMKLKVGDTLPLEMRADALVAVRCGSVVLTEGTDGPGRRPCRHPCHQAASQAQYHLCDVRKGR